MIARVEEDDNFCTEFRSKGSKTVNKKHVISNVELGKQNNCVSIDINDVNIDTSSCKKQRTLYDEFLKSLDDYGYEIEAEIGYSYDIMTSNL